MSVGKAPGKGGFGNSSSEGGASGGSSASSSVGGGMVAGVGCNGGKLRSGVSLFAKGSKRGDGGDDSSGVDGRCPRLVGGTGAT